MYQITNVTAELIKSGRVDFNYNKTKFFKKYEVGYWEIYQDVNNQTRKPVNGPYRMFRVVYSSSKYEKAISKFEELKANLYTA